MKIIESNLYQVSFRYDNDKCASIHKLIKANSIQEAFTIAQEYNKKFPRLILCDLKEQSDVKLIEPSTKTVTIDL